MTFNFCFFFFFGSSHSHFQPTKGCNLHIYEEAQTARQATSL